MKKTILATLLFLSAACAAQACDSDFCVGKKKGDAPWFDPTSACHPEEQALKAVVGMFTAEGHAAPLTQEVFAMSSVKAYGVILSYSGVQFVYQVTVDDQRCQVTSIEFKR